MALPAKKMKKIICSILLPMMCFFCFTLTAGAETKTVKLPVTVEVDHDMENEFTDLLSEKGYGFLSGPWGSPENAVSLIFSAGDYTPSGSQRSQNSVFAVATDTMEEALEEMLNSNRGNVLTRGFNCGAVDCIHYNGKTYWCVTTISANGPASMAVGKEVETFEIPVDASKIKFKLQGWKQASGAASSQVVYGTASTPVITIPNFFPEKAKGIEYDCPADTLSYTSNTPDLFTVSVNGTVTPIKTGMASMTVALKTDPQVKQDISFEIVSNLTGKWDEELDIKFANGDSYPYTGSPVTPKFYIKDKYGNLLAEGTDYRVEYLNNTDPGTATAYIWLIGNYSTPVYTGNGYVAKTFQITGKKPETEATKPDATKPDAADPGTTNPGTTGSSNVSGSNTSDKGNTSQTSISGSSSQKKTQLPKASLSKVKASGKGKIKVTWKKKSKISGYQVQYSTNKNFKKNTKTKKISGKNKTSVTISKLKRKKTYYVRIRTYKKANGKTSYGKWSSIKKVKTK